MQMYTVVPFGSLLYLNLSNVWPHWSDWRQIGILTSQYSLRWYAVFNRRTFRCREASTSVCLRHLPILSNQCYVGSVAIHVSSDKWLTPVASNRRDSILWSSDSICMLKARELDSSIFFINKVYRKSFNRPDMSVRYIPVAMYSTFESLIKTH